MKKKEIKEKVMLEQNITKQEVRNGFRRSFLEVSRIFFNYVSSQ